MSQSIIGLGVKDLRIVAISAGIDPAGLDREQMVSAIMRAEQESEALRLECQRKGLGTDGNAATLRLRLEATKGNAITPADKRLYATVAYSFVGLGLATLLVSIPHLAGELSRVTGLNLFYAVALAVVIDGAIMVSKAAETLTGKFALGNIRFAIRAFMVAALGFSAAVNASGFTQGGSDSVLATLFALLLSGGTWVCFAAGSFLLTTCEARKDQAEEAKADPVASLTASVASLKGLLALAEKAERNNGK